MTEVLREGFPKKVAVLLDFVEMRGRGEGPAQIFCHLFISAFLVNERSLFPQKCRKKMNFKLFFFRFYT